MRVVLACALVALPSLAQADLLTVSAAGKLLTTGGSGYLDEKWDGPLGYGVEAGLEVLGVDALAEAYMFDTDQYMFSGNLGFDADFGEDIRITPGIFGGAIVYYLPEPTTPSGLDLNTLPDNVKSEIGQDNLDRINDEYRGIAKDEEAANRVLTALTGRLRLTIEYKLLPLLYLGAEGDVGLHYLVSGSDASAKAKKDLIEGEKEKNPTKEAAYDALGEAIGADGGTEIDRTGMNFSAGVFVKLEL